MIIKTPEQLPQPIFLLLPRRFWESISSHEPRGEAAFRHRNRGGLLRKKNDEKKRRQQSKTSWGN